MTQRIGEATAVRVKTVERATESHVVNHGDAAVYKLSTPYEYDPGATCPAMFVSTATIMGEPETYAFPADEAGKVLSWSELRGSIKGPATHAEVLAAMGYQLSPSGSDSR